MTIQIIQSQAKAAGFTESEGHTVETAESEVCVFAVFWGQELRVIQ